MQIEIIKGRFFSILAAVVVFITVFGAACNYAIAEGPVDSVNKNGDGVALKGYDAVAYFQQNQPVKGKSEFKHQWKGAVWHFSSAANRDLFADNPEKYAPQYGGYCAYGVSKGYAVDVDPFAWKIVDGKLYLNYNKEVAKIWGQDNTNYIKQADQNWPGLIKKSEK
jgi:YHS domain-containing protein